LLVYVVARAVWLRPAAAGTLAALFLLACAGVIGVQRLLLTPFSARLAFVLALAIVVALAVEMAVRAITRSAGWRGGRALPEWTWAGLRGLVSLAVALKVGGLLYPHTFIIDAYFHLKYITYMAEGRPWEQFFGKNLSLSVMPKEEWGAARAFIPYSPFFYVVAAPLERLPVPTTLSVPVAAGILEAVKVALVFLVGLALGPVRSAARRAFAAAALYSFVPATFLLQQWGNWPTQLSLWLVTLWAAILCLFWRRLASPAVWLASTVVLSLTLLSYTVTAAYAGIFVLMLGLGGLVFARLEWKAWVSLGVSLAVATGVALIVFYGQYVDDMIRETLPTFGKALDEQGKLTTLRPSFGEFLTGHIATAVQSYHLAIIYALGLAGLLWACRGLGRGASVQVARASVPARVYALVAHGASARRAAVDWRLVWLIAWALTLPLFTLLDFYVDQAFKEFWFALPALAAVGGAWLLVMRRRGRVLRVYSTLLWLLVATLVWQSLSLWVFRLLFHNR
jgi:hypothetical protein